MIASIKSLERILSKSLPELEHLIAQKDTYYTRIEKNKKDSSGNPIVKNGLVKKRVYFSIRPELKTIQGRIRKNILARHKVSENAHGSVKNRSIITNTAVHKSKKFHFLTDLQSFFDYITSGLVYNYFISNEYSPDVSRILTELLTYEGHIPQGAPTSPSISNLIFYPTDLAMEKYCQKYNLTYSRYVDDIIISSNIDFKLETTEVLSIITGFGYKINHRKTYYKTGSVETTGTVIKHNYIKPKPSIVSKLNDPAIKESTKKGIEAFIKQFK